MDSYKKLNLGRINNKHILSPNYLPVKKIIIETKGFSFHFIAQLPSKEIQKILGKFNLRKSSMLTDQSVHLFP